MTSSSTLELVPIASIEVLAEHRYLNLISACLSALFENIDLSKGSETLSYNVQLAVQEACTNIVDHAYEHQPGGRITVQISLGTSPRRLTVDIYDSGKVFNKSQITEPDLDEPQVHGYGLFLMRNLMDEVHYERVDARNHWQLTKLLV